MVSLSKYSIVVPFKEEFLIYSTLFQTAVSVNSELFQLLTNRLPAKQSLREKYNGEIGTLCELGIASNQATDERQRLKQWYKSFQADNSYLNVTILTTYQCNLSCVYCVEEGRKKSIYMDEETTGALLNWLKKRAAETKPNEINLTFYGGEPLMNIAPIERITKEIKSWGKDKDITITTGVITNGVLLCETTVDRLKFCGVDFFKVTLDGIGSSHDRKRPCKNGKGTFNDIITNLVNLKEKEDLQLFITSNFDEENFSSASLLPAYLKILGLKPYIKRLVFKPIKNTSVVPSMSAQSCQIGGYTLDEVSKMVKLRKVLVENAYEVSEDFALGPCEFIHHNSFTIDPAGSIYPCPGFVGMSQFIMGNLTDKTTVEVDAFKNLDVPKQCTDCSYFPSCGGGCRLMSFHNTGDINNVSCELTYFKGFAPGVIRDSFTTQLESNQ